MKKKQYILTAEIQESPQNTSDFEATVKNAVLLALLARKSITQWQYEQCCARLSVSTTSFIST